MLDAIDLVIDAFKKACGVVLTRKKAEEMLRRESITAEDWLERRKGLSRENAAGAASPQPPVPDPYENPQRYAFYLRMTTPPDIYDPAVDAKYELLRAALQRRHEEGLDTFGMEF